MSRNFELLAQIETEIDVTKESDSIRPSRVMQRVVAPPIMGDVPGSVEILQLVHRVFLATTASAPRQVVFCGVENESGSSAVCAGAGRILAANTTHEVCLVDANPKSPRLSSMLGLSATPRMSVASVREQCVQLGGNLWFAGGHLFTSPNGKLPLLSQLSQRFAQLHSEFEYILIDAPGVTVSGDAALLGQLADAAILVVEADSTRRLTASKAKQILQAAGVRLLGAVLHNRSFPIPKRIYDRL